MSNAKNFCRGLVTFGLVLLTSWTALKTCSGPWFIYNIVALAINAVYFFTLAIKSMNVKKILGTMKYLSQIPEEEFADIAEDIPLNYVLR